MIRADRTATEAWLARHATVACPMGARITPAQCDYEHPLEEDVP